MTRWKQVTCRSFVWVAVISDFVVLSWIGTSLAIASRDKISQLVYPRIFMKYSRSMAGRPLKSNFSRPGADLSSQILDEVGQMSDLWVC